MRLQLAHLQQEVADFHQSGEDLRLVWGLDPDRVSAEVCLRLTSQLIARTTEAWESRLSALQGAVVVMAERRQRPAASAGGC